jgi:hypothetical protein
MTTAFASAQMDIIYVFAWRLQILRFFGTFYIFPSGFPGCLRGKSVQGDSGPNQKSRGPEPMLSLD